MKNGTGDHKKVGEGQLGVLLDVGDIAVEQLAVVAPDLQEQQHDLAQHGRRTRRVGGNDLQPLQVGVDQGLATETIRLTWSGK